MDVLIIEPLDPEVMRWLVARHSVRYAPDLAHDRHALRHALMPVRAMIIPPSVALDGDILQHAPVLRAVGRLSAGAENIDLDACTRAGVEVVRPANASAAAEAEFAIGALLQMLRRVPVVNAEGLLVGRELGGSTVGLIGMAPAARTMAQLLGAFGSRVIGYDPSLHASDALWNRWKVEPAGLRELLEQAEAVCVMLTYFTRYHGLLGERFLPYCRPSQVLVSLSPSSLFDEAVLAEVLGSGRMSAAWFDSMEPGMLEPGRPLHEIDTLQVTPRVAGTTRESRVRSAWGVARRIDELLARQAGSASAGSASLALVSPPSGQPAAPAGPSSGEASG
ncbi:D-isomer specific 2-hydroxyacid dehydrogenase family protein [Ideonella sp. A 288]|uniref:NAD(P)-dependent oxidoreductase n=1 Tax=Ideonella sp. A 288 TaxID=1962181 RepID=UPI000B4AFA62|nr:NAD(P)-dependent oxidoreductase [Ideonella sp. A 288]